jgi:hypothetical protein
MRAPGRSQCRRTSLRLGPTREPLPPTTFRSRGRRRSSFASAAGQTHRAAGRCSSICNCTRCQGRSCATRPASRVAISRCCCRRRCWCRSGPAATRPAADSAAPTAVYIRHLQTRRTMIINSRVTDDEGTLVARCTPISVTTEAKSTKADRDGRFGR